MLPNALVFSVCALAIGVAGARLSSLADAISARTGLSGSWIGVLLLATVTSLPELATGISAVRVAVSPDIAVGDALGSTIFNLALLVLLDVLHRREPLYASVGSGHTLAAAFGVMLLSIVGASILLHREGVLPSILHVGSYTVLLGILYFFAMRSIYEYERRVLREDAPGHRSGVAADGPRKLVVRFALSAAVILIAGGWLPVVGADIAEDMGWSKTFVGTLLVAASTSLPELVVTLAAWRIGRLDMAIGGLLGSNLFDLLIIAIDDVFYTQGPILANVSQVHAVTAFSAAMMSGAVIVGLVYRPRLRLLRLMSIVSVFLGAIYLVNMLVLFLHGR